MIVGGQSLTDGIDEVMRISLIEQMVQNCPKGMEHFRLFRIEYGGHASHCLCEGVIWLPETIDEVFAEKYLQGLMM